MNSPPTAAGSDVRAPRPHDDLLTQILAGAVDQDYLAASRRRNAPARPTAAFVSAVAAFGILLGVSALKTDQDRPAQAAERAQLVAEIHGRQDRLDALHLSLTSLQDDVATRLDDVARMLTANGQVAARLTTLGISAGTVAVTGPGLTITVDDAADSGSVPGGVIRATDLQLLVNGLWQAGAEAVAIDGLRLSSLSSIRYAGRAITVDYRSLSPPYVVDAIGDPDTLPARLLETEAGKVWQGLVANFAIRFDSRTSKNLTLPADSHDHLSYAREGSGGR